MGWFSLSRKKKVKNIENKANLWVKCKKCEEMIYIDDYNKNLGVCPKCSYHHRIDSREYISILLDKNSFNELDKEVTSVDVLEFNDIKPYKTRIIEAINKTGEKSAVITGYGTIKKKDIAIGIMNFSFMGGSMGSVVGEKLTRMIEFAIKKKMPVIILSCSGGARMQESILSLMQMAKISAALKKLANKKLPYISVLTNPTTGGVTASFAMLGDVNIAEPEALIGFAGPRVIEQTIRQKLPAGFQSSEFCLEHGMVDKIVNRSELKDTIYNIIDYLTN